MSLLVLSRLLSPAQFGVAAIALVFVAIGEVLRDAGLSSAAIQSRELSPAQISNLVWISTSIGALASAAALFGGSYAARFFGTADLAPVLAGLSPIFLMNGFTGQYQAELVKSMAFARLAIIDLTAQTLGVVAAIVAALEGAGVWALVTQQLVAASVVAALTVASVRRWPGLPSRAVGTYRLVRFGAAVMSTQLLGHVSRNVDTAALGYTSTPATVGIYNRAFQLLMLPLNQLNAPATRVAFPVLASLQGDPERLLSFLRRGHVILSYAVCLVFSFSYVLADDLIPAMLGPQWAPSVPIFRILAIAGVFQTLAYSCYWLFLALGLGRASLKLELVGRPIVVIGVLMGLHYGPRGVAAGYAVGVAVLWPVTLWWAARVSGVRTRVLLIASQGPLFAFGLSVLAYYAMRLLVEPSGGSLSLAVHVLVVCVAWFMTWLVLPLARLDTQVLTHTALGLVSRKRRA